MKSFNTLKVGDKAEIHHKITSEDVELFVNLTGDNNKIHTNQAYAENTPSKKIVVHGMLGASFISTVIGTKLPGNGAIWCSQNLEFLRPVRINDIIDVRVCVEKKIITTQQIILKTEIFNQHKQLVTTGTAKVKIPKERISKTKTVKQNNRNKALILGSTGSVGSAVAKTLANNGYDLILHYNKNKKRAQQLKTKLEKTGIRVVLTSGDVTKESDVLLIKEGSQKLNSFIPNVINCSTIPIYDLKFEDVEWTIIQNYLDSEVKANFLLIKSFINDWKKHKYGNFITISSIYTDDPPKALLGYVTGKSGLNGMVKAAAKELAAYGIRLNLVSPSMIESSLTADVPEKAKLIAAAMNPQKRLAKEEDVANVISFLCEEKSNFLNGETIRVNGGQLMI